MIDVSGSWDSISLRGYAVIEREWLLILVALDTKFLEKILLNRLVQMIFTSYKV